MSFHVEHSYRLDAQGKLDADDWLLIPRARLKPAFVLDEAFAAEMVRLYFETVAHWGAVPVKVEQDAHTIRLRAPLGKTAMIFAEPERIVNAQRVETSWRIAGGFLLAHRVNYGGRFYLGAEWQTDALKLYSTIRRYPPRLVAYLGGNRGAALYHQTQGRTHKRIQEKYLRQVAAQITNASEPETLAKYS
jgi:hypothetical protein